MPRTAFRLRPAALLGLTLLATGCATAPPPAAPAPVSLGAVLDSVFDDTAFAHAHWGVDVRRLDTGETVYRRNAEKMFIPASNMKLVTGAAVLQALGPEFRYRTRVEASGPVRDGILRGDLVIRGAGDPTVSERFGGDARAVFRAWADSLRAHGVRRIEGRVVGVDEVFDDLPLGRGWAWDDLESGYSAEISGLPLNEGVVEVRVAPGGRPGEAGIVTLQPATAYAPVVNRTTTVDTTVGAGEAARVEVARAATGPGVVVSGPIPRDTTFVEATVAIRNSTHFFATVLRETLGEAGIEVAGPAVDADEAEGVSGVTIPLFVHTSPPLRDILPAYMKPSQNQIAEILLRTLGAELRGKGSAAAGRAVVDSLLAVWGLDPRLLAMADGSGLSRYNLVAPELLLELLTYMDRGPHREVWRASLPVAGVDGTLAGRLRGTPAEGRIFAKTGTLSGVRALSGYLETAGGEPLGFSILVNHHTRSARDADRVIDAALLRMAEWSR